MDAVQRFWAAYLIVANLITLNEHFTDLTLVFCLAESFRPLVTSDILEVAVAAPSSLFLSVEILLTLFLRNRRNVFVVMHVRYRHGVAMACADFHCNPFEHFFRGLFFRSFGCSKFLPLQWF